jgi:hypothetical protein
MTRYFYDTEFLEDGKTIELISIGIVCEDGREYYAINAEAPWPRIVKHEWLMDNVVPHLPTIRGESVDGIPGRWDFDYGDPTFKSRDLISAEIEAFLTGEPELWADYAAYEHVVLAQLWGSMIDLPSNVPMHTNDIQTYAALNGIPSHILAASVNIARPPEHHALADARDVRDRFAYLHELHHVNGTGLPGTALYRKEDSYVAREVPCEGCAKRARDEQEQLEQWKQEFAARHGLRLDHEGGQQ